MSDETQKQSRVSAEGRAMGEQMVRMVEPWIAKLGQEGEPDERCKSCAFRSGTVPNGCIQTCLSGAPCQKPLRRVHAGEAQPSNWVEIEPELPIDMAEPDPIAIDRKLFVGVALALVVFWAVVVWGAVL